MLLPTKMAKDSIEEFENGKLLLDGASVESFEDYDSSYFKNSEFLNAETIELYYHLKLP